MSNALEQASLIMVPSGYEDGTLGSLKPTDGTGDFTFTRCNGAAQCDLAATRVNADGYIEKGYENLLSHSNSFTTTWAQVGSFNVVGNQQGYDSSNDAWSIESNTTAFDRRIQQSVSVSGVYTFAIYAKSNSTDWLLLYNGTDRVYFDLANGVVGSSESGLIIDSKIESTSVTGWYRCTATFNRAISFISVVPASGDGNSNVVTGNSIYIQDAMLNQGMVAYPYLETTTAPVAGGILEDMPRLDYSNGSCPSLLLEPSRTNLVTQSEYFAGWIVQSSTTLTTNTTETLSPEGLYNATKAVGNGTDGVLLSELSTAGGDNVKSIYLKGVSGGESVVLKDPNQTNQTKTCALTTEWQRFDLLDNQPSSFGFWVDDIPASGIYMWGAQLEQATYPTSYIPTYGVSQTRLSEFSAFELSVFDFFSLGNTESGTFFLETKFTKPSSQNVVDVFSQGGSGTNAWLGTGFQIRDTGGSRNFVVQNIDTLVDDYIKIAIRRDNTTFNVFVNGVKSATTATITNPLKWFDHIALYRNNQNVKQMMEFPTALSDDECIALTTIS